MFNPVKNIIARATRKPDEPINVITGVTHAPFEVELSRCNVRLFGIQTDGILPWNECRPVPPTYHILERSKDVDSTIPKNVTYHVALSQSIEAHLPHIARLATLMGLPLISAYHTTAPIWNSNWRQYVEHYKKNDPADIKTFITHSSRDQWGYKENEAEVIYHAGDTDNFYPLGLERKNFVMYTCNALRERDYACGYRLWEAITYDLPRLVVGKDKDPNFSKPIQDPKELNRTLNTCGVYLNASIHSPFPMSLIECMLSGTPIVSTASYDIPLVLHHKKSALLFPADKPELGRKYVEMVLNDKDLAASLGAEARKTALEVFSRDRFVKQWNAVFERAANTPYRGI